MAHPQPVTQPHSEPHKRSLLSLVQRQGGAVNTHVAAFLGPNVTVQGEVNFSGGLRIDGAVCGNVTSGEDTSGTLTIGDGGRVKGDIRVGNLIVYGQVEGNVFVSGQIDIREQALITGDVHYRSLEIVPGGVIEGRLVPN